MSMEDIFEALCHCSESSDYEGLSKKTGASFEVWRQKHRELQNTDYVNVHFEGIIASVEIESGISNGTLIRQSWDYPNGWRNTEEVNELIGFDLSFCKDNTPAQKATARAWLKSMESWLRDRHRKIAYDNYVTGGNAKPLVASNNEDRVNLIRLKKMEKQKIFVEYLYKEITQPKSFELIYRSAIFAV